MNVYTAMAIQNVAAIVGAVYLITHDYPWWALLLLLLSTVVGKAKP